MSEGKLEIRCTHCGYPYPMTRLQAEVFDGRNMGCMACGRPFLVKLRADLPPEPKTDGDGTTATDAAHAAGTTADTTADATDADTADSAASVAAAPGRSAIAGRSPVASAGSRMRIATGARLGLAAAMLALLTVTVAVVYAFAQAVPGDAHLQPLPGAARVMMTWVAPTLAAIAVVAGLLGIWQSVIAVRRDLPDEYRPRAGYAVTALALGASELAMLGVIAMVVWTPLSRGLDASRRAASMQNLQQVGNQALAAARSAGTYPDSIESMIQRGQVPPGSDSVPGAGQRYRYLGKAMPLIDEKATTPTSQVLAMEPLDAWADGGVFVLFADASLVYANRPQAEAIVRELESGKNPPPSVAPLRR